MKINNEFKEHNEALVRAADQRDPALWNTHHDIVDAIVVDDTGELATFFLHCLSDGRYRSVAVPPKGEGVVRWVPAAGLSFDTLYELYVRWCVYEDSRAAPSFDKYDVSRYLLARCTSIPRRNDNGGLVGEALIQEWYVDPAQYTGVPLELTMPELYDHPPPPDWAMGNDGSTDRFDMPEEAVPPTVLPPMRNYEGDTTDWEHVTPPPSPTESDMEDTRCGDCGSYEEPCRCPPTHVKDVPSLVDIADILAPKEDLDALAADIEDPTVTARDMRAKKRARAKHMD